jgi:tetratricopeptide (TPR) repeat protein
MPRNDRRRPGGHGQSAHTSGAARREQAGAASTASLSDEQRAQVEALIAGLPRLAEQLRAATAEGRAALVAALAPVTGAPEPVALAFAARLGTLRGAEARMAADVAHALGELGEPSAVAREARRSRIRLRSAGAIPLLEVPMPTTPKLSLVTAGEPLERPILAEAYISRTRETGEVQLVLAWQEQRDSSELHLWAILLDFWQEGARDFIHMDTMRRSRFQREVLDPLRTQLHVAPVQVNWAQARRLLLEALDVNRWRGTEPGEAFRGHRAEIDRRLLAEPEDEAQTAEWAAELARFQREGDRPYILPNMEPDETVVNWIGAWSLGDYGLAYDLLADENPLRRQQAREEYVALRRQWANEAQPHGLRMTLVREQERRASALWVPSSPAGAVGALGQRPNEEAFWSLELTDVELGGALAELPMATLLSAETGRHWYWTGYSLARDATFNLWLIDRIRDEGANSQALTLDELQQRVAQAREAVDKITAQEPPQPGSEEAAEALRAITGALTSALHYRDALAVKLPLDETLYREALMDARSLGNHERAAALIERRVARSGGAIELRFEWGIEQYLVADQYARQGNAEAEAAWLDRAVRTLARVAEEQPTGEHLQGLGELLARQGHFDEAEARLREGIALEPDRAMLYSDLADVLMNRIGGANLDRVESLSEEEQQRVAREALEALREASARDQTIPGIYTRMGAIYDILGQPEDSLLALQEAVRHDPADAEARYALGTLYLSRGQIAAAVPELETAVQHAPLNIPIRLALASAYAAAGRVAEARRDLDLIERLQPGLPQVAELRARLAKRK